MQIYSKSRLYVKRNTKLHCIYGVFCLRRLTSEDYCIIKLGYTTNSEGLSCSIPLEYTKFAIHVLRKLIINLLSNFFMK